MCAAYARRLRTGDGDVIDFAIYEAVMKLVESQLTEFAANGTEHQRLGNRLEDTAPRGAYRCGDGAYVALSGSTQEVAQVALFLCSPLASYVTGQTLEVNGGWRG